MIIPNENNSIKEELKKDAVATTMVLAALTPSMANAAPENNNIPAAHQTTATTSENTNSTPQSAYVIPVDRSAIKTEMKEDCAKAEQREIAIKLENPVLSGNRYDPQIGSWSNPGSISENINEIAQNFQGTIKDDPAKPYQTVPTDAYSNESLNNGSAVAALSFSENKINFKTYTPEQIEAMRAKDDANNPYNYALKYAEGDVITKNNIAVHEGVHYQHYNYDGMQDKQTTPTAAVIENHLTEKIAYTAQYMNLAHTYTLMKEQGATHYQTVINGEVTNRPLAEMLDTYPGLREAVEKHGFDPKNNKDIQKITELASTNWDTIYQSRYQKQHISAADAALDYQNSLPFSERMANLENEKEHLDQVKARMLTNVNIGNNTYVDLSKQADLLDNLPFHEAENLVKKANGNTKPLSYSDMKVVNDYLESKGLTTDEQKDSYIAEQYNKIANRLPGQDDELLLAMTKYNKNVRYTDGIKETIYDINGKDNLVYNISDELIGTRGELKQTKEALISVPALNLDLSPMPSITLPSSHTPQTEAKEAPTPETKSTPTLTAAQLMMMKAKTR